jgi:hypothetical protein
MTPEDAREIADLLRYSHRPPEIDQRPSEYVVNFAIARLIDAFEELARRIEERTS